MGTYRLPNHYQGNGYVNRYPRSNLINRIIMVTNNHNNRNCYELFLYWVRLKTTTEIDVEDSSVSKLVHSSKDRQGSSVTSRRSTYSSYHKYQ
jgi:hypothetical protein